LQDLLGDMLESNRLVGLLSSVQTMVFWFSDIDDLDRTEE
jgi:hypothetical protein